MAGTVQQAEHGDVLTPENAMEWSIFSFGRTVNAKA